MNIVEKSVICGYGWQANWRGSCGAVRDVIRGPFNCPRIVDSIPYAVLHCLCESETSKCCGCGAKCRRYSCPPCAQPCIPTGCSVGHSFAGYRTANIGMGVPDPWSEKIICCPANAKGEDKSVQGNEVVTKDLVSDGTCLQKASVSWAQGIPDPWLCWPMTCATIAAMAPKPCPVHGHRGPQPSRQPAVREWSPRPGICGSLKKFLRCQRRKSRSRKPRRKWFRCRKNGQRDTRCCCCCCCCCCHEHQTHGSRRCCCNNEGGCPKRRSSYEERHPLNELSSYHGDNGKGLTYPPIASSEPDSAQDQLSSAGKNGREDGRREGSKSLSKAAPMTINKPQSKSKTKPQSESQLQPQSESQPQPQPQPKPQPKPLPESQLQSQPQVKPKSQPKPQSKLQPQLKSPPQPRSQSQSKKESKPQHKPQSIRPLSKSQNKSLPRSIGTLEDSIQCTPQSEPLSVSQSPKQTTDVSVQYDECIGEDISRPLEQQPYESWNFAKSHFDKVKSMQEARGTQTETWERSSVAEIASNSRNQSVMKNAKCARSMQTQTSDHEKERTMVAENANAIKATQSEISEVIKPGVVMILANNGKVGLKNRKAMKENRAETFDPPSNRSPVGLKDTNEMKKTQVEKCSSPTNISSMESMSNPLVDRYNSELESSVSMHDSASEKTYPCVRKKTYPCVPRIDMQEPKHLLNDPCFVCACSQSRAKTLHSSSSSSRANSSKGCRQRKTSPPNKMVSDTRPLNFSPPTVSHFKNMNNTISSGARRSKTVQLYPQVSCQDSREDSSSKVYHNYPLSSIYPDNDGHSRLHHKGDSVRNHSGTQCEGKNSCVCSKKGLWCACETWPKKKPLKMNGETCDSSETMVANVSQSANNRKDDFGLMLATPKSDCGPRIRTTRERDCKKM